MKKNSQSHGAASEEHVGTNDQQQTVTLFLDGYLTPEVQNLRHPVAREARNLARKVVEAAGGMFISCTVDEGQMYVVVSGAEAIEALKATFTVDGASVVQMTEAQAIRRKLLRNRKQDQGHNQGQDQDQSRAA